MLLGWKQRVIQIRSNNCIDLHRTEVVLGHFLGVLMHGYARSILVFVHIYHGRAIFYNYE
jgi:hypothetical protein